MSFKVMSEGGCNCQYSEDTMAWQTFPRCRSRNTQLPLTRSRPRFWFRALQVVGGWSETTVRLSLRN